VRHHVPRFHAPSAAIKMREWLLAFESILEFLTYEFPASESGKWNSFCIIFTGKSGR
jgi:hypothetical protein